MTPKSVNEIDLITDTEDSPSSAKPLIKQTDLSESKTFIRK